MNLLSDIEIAEFGSQELDLAVHLHFHPHLRECGGSGGSHVVPADEPDMYGLSSEQVRAARSARDLAIVGVPVNYDPENPLGHYGKFYSIVKNPNRSYFPHYTTSIDAAEGLLPMVSDAISHHLPGYGPIEWSKDLGDTPECRVHLWWNSTGGHVYIGDGYGASTALALVAACLRVTVSL